MDDTSKTHRSPTDRATVDTDGAVVSVRSQSDDPIRRAALLGLDSAAHVHWIVVPVRSVVTFSIRLGLGRLESSVDIVQGTMRSDPRWHPLRGLDLLLDGARVRTGSPTRDERLQRRAVFGIPGNADIRLFGSWSKDVGRGRCHIDAMLELRGERHSVQLIATSSNVIPGAPETPQELTVGVTGRLDFSSWHLPLPPWWTGRGLVLGRSAALSMTLRAVSAVSASG